MEHSEGDTGGQARVAERRCGADCINGLGSDHKKEAYTLTLAARGCGGGEAAMV